ncbi:helix-turn-helix domain-containing protein [Microbacterium sp. C7(2022)]|uniref:helix-turn-helix domain-containing protein n=1 Tax=Microbacterium sp. C7(2022) TaxID=2992759 RepID=UPI00237A21E0|nr:helix-turn-helix domain-containing protein [Microbacterium sp. C7(2022)]MDE0545983.1 helix-turn-helix domain-containing protein [Microbacterium sp. C7(2022)]
MSSPADSPTLTALDTRRVAPSDRPDYWSAGIAERFFPMQVDAVTAPSFDARLAVGDVGAISVGAIQGHPHRVLRTSRMIAAGDPESILLYLLVRGAVRLEQEDRSCVMAPGDIACHDTSRPSAFEGRSAFEVLVFSIPRWFIGIGAADIAARSATTATHAGMSLARVAAPFLAGVARTAAGGAGLPADQAEAAAEMILPLLRTSFIAEPPAAHSSSSGLLGRMQRFALAHLHEPDLGPERLAAAHFVSTRYVHKLFAAGGSGVSEWIRDRRLEGATADLRSSPTSPIADVAARWGYRHPASFSRAFRERYGCAPRELRAMPLSA